MRTHIVLEVIKSRLQDQNSQLEQIVQQKTVKLKEMLEASIHSMALMAEIRDPYTAGHQQQPKFPDRTLPLTAVTSFRQQFLLVDQSVGSA